MRRMKALEYEKQIIGNVGGWLGCNGAREIFESLGFGITYRTALVAFKSVKPTERLKSS